MGACILLNQTPLRAGGFSERALSPAHWYGWFPKPSPGHDERTDRDRDGWREQFKAFLLKRGKGGKTDLKMYQHLILPRFSPPYTSTTVHWKCVLITPDVQCVCAFTQPLTFLLITLHYIH